MVQNPPCWRASCPLGHPEQSDFIKTNLHFLCCGCPSSGWLALQHGGFCTMWPLAAKGPFHYGGARNNAGFRLKSKAILTSFPRWIFLKIGSLLGFSWYLYWKNLRENYTWATAINGKNENYRNWPNVWTEFVLTLRGDTLAKFYRAKFGQTRFETS